MKKMIYITILSIVIIFIGGCMQQNELYRVAKGELESGGKIDYISSKNITECLDNPSLHWQEIDSQAIIARVDNKSDDFISDLANKFEIVNLKIEYKSDDITFVEFNIEDNLPIRKICNFLNSEDVSYHYPARQARTFIEK